MPKEWKAWKKLKGEDIGLGWNPIKRTVDASDDWWESRLKVVPEAKKFRTSGIDPKFEGKLDQMFMGIVATGDKAWAPSSSTLRSDFFEDVNNEIPEENEEENVRNDVHILNDVHISNDVQIDGNTDNMSQAISSLTPVIDPYGIPQVVKVPDSMSEELPKVMSIVENSSGDESDDEREKKESGETWIQEILEGHESRCMINFRMSKMVFTSLLRVLETRYNLQTSRNISSTEMLGIFLYILGTGVKFPNVKKDFKDCIGAIDGTHTAAILPPNE
ncbi:hypothetical protein CXB51_034737 [Gossypium anomalum]|uniref:DUF8040 domain-containing protein n=1 Tax=Gossypium anomalum TaxID=47600 RepID=A0A8J6CHH2_9ROSI|nr:hypothetical protein CXB51_034737 [Gossypium anomalum]